MGTSTLTPMNKVINGAWENSTAYHKLTFESGTRMLDEKWNQYMADNNVKLSKTLNNQSISKRYNSAPSKQQNQFTSGLVTYNRSNQITLPASTQQRLNQHREWLKRFKADTDLNNNNLAAAASSSTTSNFNNK